MGFFCCCFISLFYSVIKGSIIFKECTYTVIIIMLFWHFDIKLMSCLSCLWIYFSFVNRLWQYCTGRDLIGFHVSSCTTKQKGKECKYLASIYMNVFLPFPTLFHHSYAIVLTLMYKTRDETHLTTLISCIFKSFQILSVINVYAILFVII